jgi:hypothetical protein
MPAIDALATVPYVRNFRRDNAIIGKNCLLGNVMWQDNPTN